MERLKRIESGEILLPEAIVQHIHSFMSTKDAARTSALSKCWYSAWSTRPNLDLNCSDFMDRGGWLRHDWFSDFSKKTIQRYEELNLPIESVSLCVSSYRLSLANELFVNTIVKTMQMGATDIKLVLTGGPTTMFNLPKELLESETLDRLSVSGCKIDLGVNGKVSWLRLKSLTLHSMYVEDDVVIWDIILGCCPLIEELVLSECKYVSGRNRMLELGPNLFELHKLRCLSLVKVKIDTSFFCDLSFKFPCLKDLTVHYCFDYKAIKIYSPSLERISFAVDRKILKANFEVPCIQKFTFSGSRLPSLFFETSSSLKGKWESDISVKCFGTPSWFRKLKEFLIDLSHSRISLTLRISTICEHNCGDIKGFSKPPVVDNLRLLMGYGATSFVNSVLLDGLFWSCRPKLISCTNECADEWKADIHFLKLFYERLHVAENCRIPNLNTMFGRLRDLNEMNVEFCDENLSQWRPALSMKALLDAYQETKLRIRYKLRWE